MRNHDRNALLLEVISTQNEIAAAGLDLDAVMDRVVNRALGLTGADGAVIEIAQDGEMVYTAAAGTASAHLGVRLAVATSLSGMCVTTGEILRCDDAETDGRVDLEACRRVGAMSLICVPLRHEGRPVGVLKVYSARPCNFGAQDVEVLELLSGLVAAHMANASRFEASEHDRLHDTLTGLPNRRAYDERLVVEASRAARHGRPLCLCLIDLDRFKEINDTFGHPAGDAVLKGVAEVLRGGRTGDETYRLGGDEFAVLMAETNLEGARLAAWRLTQAIGAARLGTGRITASFGVAESSGEDALALHIAADQALYAAKTASALN